MSRTMTVLLALALFAANAWAQAPQLVMPLLVEETWILTRAYNAPPTHLGSNQYALDFTQPGCEAWGKVVYASAPGVVEIMNYNDYGYNLYIDHGNGYKTHYAHLQQNILVSNGQTVDYGTQIGLCGNSGNVTGAACPEHPGTHLHFRMLHNGVPVKPEPISGYNDFPDGEPSMNYWVRPIGFYPYSSENNVVYPFLSKYHQLLSDGHPLGNPWQNTEYGSMYVHEVNGMLIQDFKDLRDEGGASNGYYSPYTAIIYHEDPWMSVEPHLLKEGFWDEYMTHFGWLKFGAPVTDEYPNNGEVWQSFSLFGPNYATNPNDYERFYFTWNESSQTLKVLDHNYQEVSEGQTAFLPTTTAKAMANKAGGRQSGKTVDFDKTSTKKLEGGSRIQANLSSDKADLFDKTLDQGEGVYNSGAKVADFGQSIGLVNGDTYSSFYAKYGSEFFGINPFTVAGDDTIYFATTLYPDVQFDGWSVSPSTAIEGAPFHLEGQISNYGQAPWYAEQARIRIVDPNADIIGDYSLYGVTLEPNSSLLLWVDASSFALGEHTTLFQAYHPDGYWTNFSYGTINVVSCGVNSQFSATPVYGQAPLEVSFNNLTTGGASSWLWNFGDGGTSTLQNPSHNYQNTGIYTVSLTAYNASGGNLAVEDSLITVVGPAVQAQIGHESYNDYWTPAELSFSDLSSNNPTDWSWNFGDGNTSTSQHPIHTYEIAGDYQVILAASNFYSSDSDTINVHVKKHVAPDFSANVLNSRAPVEISFQDLSSGNPSSWSWNFGDGGTSTSQNPAHVYTVRGVYDVRMEAENSDELDYAAKENYIVIMANGTGDMGAAFAAATNSGIAPMAVQFTDYSVGSPTAWYWYFGDGTTSNEQNPIHTYTTAGVYEVGLNVEGPSGSSFVSYPNFITVASFQLNFSGTPTSGTAPLTIQFTDESNGQATWWSWHFGDGGYSGEQNPVHTYESAGVYDVQLQVIYGSIRSLTKQDYISVVDPFVANFSGTPTSVYTGSPVQFTDQSTGGPTAWSWSFGDGATSSGQNPAHTYTVHGTYTVSLIVSNAAEADTLVRINYITSSRPPIEEDPPYPHSEPNPSNPVAVISFKLERPGHARVDVFDIRGRKVQTLLDQDLNAGVHQVTFDGRELASGSYFYMISSAEGTDIRKITVLK